MTVVRRYRRRVEERERVLLALRGRPTLIEACQWFRNGDHPDDDCDVFNDPDTGRPFQGEGHVVRYYRHPSVPGTQRCVYCDIIMHEHGWLDSPWGYGADTTVCPGDFVATVVEPAVRGGNLAAQRFAVKRFAFADLWEELPGLQEPQPEGA